MDEYIQLPRKVQAAQWTPDCNMDGVTQINGFWNTWGELDSSKQVVHEGDYIVKDGRRIYVVKEDKFDMEYVLPDEYLKEYNYV